MHSGYMYIKKLLGGNLIETMCNNSTERIAWYKCML